MSDSELRLDHESEFFHRIRRRPIWAVRDFDYIESGDIEDAVRVANDTIRLRTDWLNRDRGESSYTDPRLMPPPNEMRRLADRVEVYRTPRHVLVRSVRQALRRQVG